MDLAAILAAMGRLEELTDDELTELAAAIATTYAQLRDDGTTELAALRELVTARGTVREEETRRADLAAARQAEIAALDAEMNPPEEVDEEAPEGDGETETPAEEGETPSEEEETPVPEAEAVTPTPEAEAEPVPEQIAASARPSAVTPPATPTPTTRVTPRAPARRASLAALANRQPRPSSGPPAELGTAVITASADIPNVAAGTRIQTAEAFGRAFYERNLALGSAPLPVGSPIMKYPVMTVRRPKDPELTIPEVHTPEKAGEVMDLAVKRFLDQIESNVANMGHGPAVLLAAGGPCAPAEVSYDVPFTADASRPFTAAIPTVNYPRGRVSFFLPLCYSRGTARSVADAVTNSTTTVTSATAAFVAADVGKGISGTGIPAGSTIVSITSGTSIVISQAATASASGVTITIGGADGRTGRVITQAQDEAGYIVGGGTTGNKTGRRIDCPTAVTCGLSIILNTFTLGNWIERAFPEYVSAWRNLVDVEYAVAFEQFHMGQVVSNSNTQLLTAAVGYGAMADSFAELARLTDAIRSARRLAPTTMFRWVVPSWFIDVLKVDLARSFRGSDAGEGFAQFRVTDAQIISWYRQFGINLSTYIDESGPIASGNVAQVFALPTTGALPKFPVTTRTFLWREGAWVRGSGGELNLGTYRDSVLNQVNDLQTWVEEWSSLCWRGCAGESFVIDAAWCGNGASAGTVAPIACASLP